MKKKRSAVPPALREHLREISRRGVEARRAKRAAAPDRDVLADWPLEDGRLPETPDDARLLAAWGTKQLIAGRIDWHTCHELTVACTAVIRAFNVSELARRMTAAEALVERLVANAKKGGRGAATEA